MRLEEHVAAADGGVDAVAAVVQFLPHGHQRQVEGEIPVGALVAFPISFPFDVQAELVRLVGQV